MTAQNIAKWLGGFDKVRAMVGGANFVQDANGLSFEFKGYRKANKVRIAYDTAADLYDMTFYKWNPRKLEVKKVAEYRGLFGGDLRRVFEEETGLYLSL